MRKIIQYVLSYAGLAAWVWLLWVGLSVDKSFADNAIMFGVVTFFMTMLLGILAWAVDLCTMAANMYSRVEKKYLNDQ